jgi:hypothetical protein
MRVGVVKRGNLLKCVNVFSPSFLHFRPVCVKFFTDVQKMILKVYEFFAFRHTESHNLFRT